MAPSPPYGRAPLALLGLILVLTMLYPGRGILIPIACGVFLTVLVSPIQDWLQERRIPHVAAISACVLLVVVVFSGVAWFISIQVASFSESIPALEKKLDELMTRSQATVAERFSIAPARQADWFERHLRDLLGGGAGFIRGLILSLPMIAALKVVFDQIGSLRPSGLPLGTRIPGPAG